MVAFAAFATFGFAALCTCLLMVGPAHAQDRVRLASDEWCPFICARSGQVDKGLLIEMSEQILRRAGYQPESLLLPLNRAMLMAEEGQIEGVYAPAIDDRLIHSKPLFESRACFYALTDNPWQFAGLASLNGILVGAIADYGYDAGPFDEWIEARKRERSSGVHFSTGDTAGEKNIRMLLLGRLPVVIEHEAVAARLLAAQGNDAAAHVREAGCLPRALPLVIGLSKTSPITPRLVQAINAGIEDFRKTPAYTALARKYMGR